MMCRFVYFLILLFHAVLPSAEDHVDNDVTDKILNIVPNKPEITELAPNKTAKLMVNVDAHTRYVLFQAHSQKVDVMLSSIPLTGIPNYSTYVKGLDIGLVAMLKLESDSAAVYLKNVGDENATIVVKIQLYGSQDPVPGGCNTEFEVEIAPYLKLNYDINKTAVNYQHGSVGYPRSQPQPSCDTGVKYLTYDVYVYFMDEENVTIQAYIEAVNMMTNFTNIQQNAAKLPRRGNKLTFAIPTYRRLGVVFNVVVCQKVSGMNRTSCVPYVPIVSYGCSLSGRSDSCDDILSPFEWVLGVLGAMAGLFFCFCGHRYFSVATFFFGFTTLSLILFIVLERFSPLSYIDLVSIVLVLGAVGGVICFTIWWITRSPFLTVLLAGLNLGFLLACVVYFTPLGQDHVLVKDEAYWPLFCCFMMVIPILFIGFNLTKQLHILACSIIGSYAVVVLLDRYAGGILVYIVLNVLRRASSKDYGYVTTLIPFQIIDIVLSSLWVLLASMGVICQWVRERHRPPFPVPPSPLNRSVIDDHNVTTPERAPLLTSNPHNFRKKRRNYATTDEEEQSLPYT